MRHAHRDRTTGSSSDDTLSMCGPAAGPRRPAEVEPGLSVLVGAGLASSSLVEGALALRCWLAEWEVEWTFFDVRPHKLCRLEGETLEASELQSASAGRGPRSTSGVTGFPGLRWT